MARTARLVWRVKLNTRRADKKRLFFAWDSLAILAIYRFALCFLYTMR
jgi:hypothetical protein